MLVQEQFDRVFFQRCCGRNIPTDDKEKALKLIEEHSLILYGYSGTRGNVGKKILNADTQFMLCLMLEMTTKNKMTNSY